MRAPLSIPGSPSYLLNYCARPAAAYQYWYPLNPQHQLQARSRHLYLQKVAVPQGSVRTAYAEWGTHLVDDTAHPRRFKGPEI